MTIKKCKWRNNDEFLFQIDHSDARSAELNVLVAEVCNVGNRSQVLADQLAQDARDYKNEYLLEYLQMFQYS